MKLSAYLKPMPLPEREAFAIRCGTTLNHLRNVAFSGKRCGDKLAVAIERESDQMVRRWELRPDDWFEVWPDLPGAPPVPETVEEARHAA